VRVIADASGNLYGSTVLGGKFGDGCIFELRPSANGGWHESILYNFSRPDGSSPDGSLVFDTAGNLYGTTAGGGTHGGGVVFELSPTSSGPWTETILHNFGNGTDSTDGYDPQAEMVFDSAGNLFGTTQFGGTGSGFENGGTVFRLSPSADGWNYSQLYSFPGSYSGPDGNLPAGGLAIDQSGNLFGVAQAGGANGSGAVYELSPVGDGTYTEKIIFSFNGNNGRLPNSTPVFDSAGNLYGTRDWRSTMQLRDRLQADPSCQRHVVRNRPVRLRRERWLGNCGPACLRFGRKSLRRVNSRWHQCEGSCFRAYSQHGGTLDGAHPA